ncbi:hypothetical protein [Parasphingopyxis sp.]|uniref:hypothetical protein n=1 Tax=Parasphingopyxis sp. TaxID=1920299 RepID=UPI0026272790|nr:hypothetical protein [Parasphingopyxis sp.]
MLRIILSIVAAIILIIVAVAVVRSILSMVLYGFALLLIGYVVWYFLSGSKRAN